MQKKFLSSLGLILLLNLLVKPFYILGIDAEVQNQVGKADYGIYFTLLNLSFIFNILIDLGINNFNNRNIAQNSQLISNHFSKLFSVKALLAILYGIITIALGWILGYTGFAMYMLLVLAFNQILVSFILFGRSNLAALQLFSQDSIVSVLDRALLIVFCGILLFTNTAGYAFEIEWFVYLQTMAYGLTLIVAFAMLLGKSGKLRWNIHKPFALSILRKSFPYALFMLTGALYYRVDGIMLEQLLENGNVEAGAYAQGFRFYEAAGMFAYLFAVLLLPLYSKMLKTNPEEIRGMVQLAARLLIGVTVATAITVYFHGDFILNWRYTDVSQNSEWAFVCLMIGFVGVGMFYVYGTLMTANENLLWLNIISFGGLVLNLILNFSLIPDYGSLGAAFTTMITQLFAGSSMMFFVVGKFKYGFNGRLLFQFALFALLAIALNMILDKYIDLADLPYFILSALGSGALLIITGLFSTKKFLAMVGSHEKPRGD